MKGKNLSKVLAFLLAAVMIFSALPLMAFASDETANVYTVSNESPAIPMTAGTKIAVADLAVTFSDGTVVAGDALTWASSADSVVIKDGYIIAKEAGPVKLTVTAEGKTRNVYAAVATKEDAAKGLYKFYTYDFANGMGDEWVVDTAYSGTKTKNPWTYNEQGQLILGTATSKQMSYTKTKIDPVTGQFVPAAYDPAEQYPSAIWIDTPYFYGSKYASTMEEAFDKGIIKSALYNKAVSLGAYIPFVNTVDNDVVTYYKEDGTTATKGNMTQAGSYMYSKNPMFNEFTNYTSGAKVLNVFIGTKNDGFKFGMLGRVTYGTEHIHEYIGLQINANDTAAAKGVSYARAAASDSSTIWFHLSNYGQTPTAISGLEFSALKSSSANLANSSEFVEITTKFHDKNMTVTSGEETITTDCSSISRNPDVRAGSIGIAGHYTSFAVKEMYAAINSEYLVNIPEAIEVYYTVSYGAPAIPMNVNTAVDLDFINVEMDKNGTVVSGEKIVWNAAKQEGLYLNKKDNKVSVYTAGNYKLTATYNGVSKNVWIIAQTAGQDKIYLVNIPALNSSTFVASDWKVYGQDDKTGVALNLAIGTNASYIQTPQDRSFILYTNEIFKDFADYTVETSVDGATADQETANSNRGSGIVGRIGLNDAGVWDYSGIALYIMQNKQLAVRKNEVTRSFAYLGTGSDIFKRDEEGNKLYGGNNGTTELTVPELKVWYGTNYRTLKNVFDGNKAEIYLDGEMLYDTTTLSKYPCADQTAPGYPGVMSHDSRARVKSFCVYLNSNAMPNAIAAEVAPEAEIVITGSGDAEVEAVVGSDNTFTVEIAPAEGYKVKVGSLVIDGKRVLDSDATGRVYTFTSENLNATTISVEYIPDDGTFNSMMLGATIPVNPEKKGIRFGARTDFIRRNGETGFLGDKVLVDGVVYEPTEVGMLFIPSALIDGELTVNTERATRQAVSKVVKLTGDFSDIAITLVGIPESFFGVQISSRMYVAYEVDGETKYVYTEVIERSYNDVVAAIGK